MGPTNPKNFGILEGIGGGGFLHSRCRCLCVGGFWWREGGAGICVEGGGGLGRGCDLEGSGRFPMVVNRAGRIVWSPIRVIE